MCVTAHVFTLTATKHWLHALIWQTSREKPASRAISGAGALSGLSAESSAVVMVTHCSGPCLCIPALLHVPIRMAPNCPDSVTDQRMLDVSYVDRNALAVDAGAPGQCVELLFIIVFVQS